MPDSIIRESISSAFRAVGVWRSILAVLRGIRECGDGCVIRDDVRFDREGTTVGFALDRLQVSAFDLVQKS
jgi:hypothetical protein